MVMIRSWPPICSRKLEKSGIGTWPHWRTIKPTFVIQANVWISSWPATPWNVISSGHCWIKIVFQHYFWSGLIFCYAAIPIKCGLWNPDMDFLVWLHPIIAQCLFWLHLMGERICQRGAVLCCCRQIWVLRNPDTKWSNEHLPRPLFKILEKKLLPGGIWQQ